MNTNLTITIQPFGAAKKCFATPIIIIIPKHSTIIELRKILINTLNNTNQHFSQETIIYDSVFANDHQILAEDFSFTENITISLLPPVCGG